MTWINLKPGQVFWGPCKYCGCQWNPKHACEAMIADIGPIPQRELDEDDIQSAHVIMVPWCQCCETRVEFNHICECERG